MENEKQKTDKVRFTVRLGEKAYHRMKQMYKQDNCESMNEFIEKAVLFYMGYLSAEDNKSYLPNIVTSTLKGIVAESDNRQSRMFFKLAVEMAMMMNVIASGQNIDKLSLERLRGECVKEVKRTNGSFSLEDAVDWQKG